MTSFIDISILGDKKLQKKLSKLDVKLQKQYVRKAINRAMLPVRERAKSLVPVDSGRLHQSIKRRSKSKRGFSSAMIVTGDRFDLGIPAGAKGYYPAAIEYGTRNMPAQSFMRKALTELRSRVLRKTGEYINGYIVGRK